jgi:Endomembrane protein 70
MCPVDSWVPGLTASQGMRRSQGPGQEPKILLNNHLRFTILFNLNPVTDLSRIVGFEVEPYSTKHRYEGEWPTDPNAPTPTLLSCNPHRNKLALHDAEQQEVKEGEEIIFTYDIMFQVRPPAQQRPPFDSRPPSSSFRGANARTALRLLPAVCCCESLRHGAACDVPREL